MVEMSDVTKARPERVTPRPLQQRLQWTAPLKHNKIKELQPSLMPPLWADTSLIRKEVRVQYLQRREVLNAVLVDIQS